MKYFFAFGFLVFGLQIGLCLDNIYPTEHRHDAQYYWLTICQTVGYIAFVLIILSLYEMKKKKELNNTKSNQNVNSIKEESNEGS
jgi:FtsH-binding integral membrane protein